MLVQHQATIWYVWRFFSAPRRDSGSGDLEPLGGCSVFFAGSLLGFTGSCRHQSGHVTSLPTPMSPHRTLFSPWAGLLRISAYYVTLPRVSFDPAIRQSLCEDMKPLTNMALQNTFFILSVLVILLDVC